MLPRRSGSGAGVCGFTGRCEGFVGTASSPFTDGMRAAFGCGRSVGVRSRTCPRPSAPGRLRGHELLAAVAEGTAGAVGEEFLRCLARNVAEAFAAKLVLIAEASDPSGHARARARLLVRRRLHRRAVRVRHRRPAVRGRHRVPVGVVPGGADRALPRGPGRRSSSGSRATSRCACARPRTCTSATSPCSTRARWRPSEEDAAALRIFAARASAELERRNQARALAESRARVIEAADKERRRVGRDLHDGAQQRLLAVSNLLRVSRMKLAEDDPAHELVARAEARSSRRRTRSCASSRAGCTRSRCASAGSGRRWRRCASPRTCRSRSTSTRARCRCRSRAARTSWRRSRSPTPRATRRRARSTCGSRREEATLHGRGARRRHRRRRHRGRDRPAGPGRPRRRARRALRGRQPAPAAAPGSARRSRCHRR